jgi:hypothetical protein
VKNNELQLMIVLAILKSKGAELEIKLEPHKSHIIISLRSLT